MNFDVLLQSNSDSWFCSGVLELNPLSLEGIDSVDQKDSFRFVYSFIRSLILSFMSDSFKYSLNRFIELFTTKTL